MILGTQYLLSESRNERKWKKGPEGIKKSILRREDKDLCLYNFACFSLQSCDFFFLVFHKLYFTLLILSQMLFICASWVHSSLNTLMLSSYLIFLCVWSWTYVPRCALHLSLALLCITELWGVVPRLKCKLHPGWVQLRGDTGGDQRARRWEKPGCVSPSVFEGVMLPQYFICC